MIPEDERPPIEDQKIGTAGTWRGGNPMGWVPGDSETPVGPVLPQEHPGMGMWVPQSGGFMQWVDEDPEPVRPYVMIVDGDEQQ